MKKQACALWIVVSLFAIVACNHKQELRAEIPDDKFVALLTDVRILEGYYSVRFERVDSSKGKIAAYYKETFDKHGVTKQQFESTMTYYASHPNEMMAIEEKVGENLSAFIADDRKKHFVPADTTSSRTKQR
jgi:hypothetical protein